MCQIDPNGLWWSSSVVRDTDASCYCNPRQSPRDTLNAPQVLQRRSFVLLHFVLWSFFVVFFDCEQGLCSNWFSEWLWLRTRWSILLKVSGVIHHPIKSFKHKDVWRRPWQPWDTVRDVNSLAIHRHCSIAALHSIAHDCFILSCACSSSDSPEGDCWSSLCWGHRHVPSAFQLCVHFFQFWVSEVWTVAGHRSGCCSAYAGAGKQLEIVSILCVDAVDVQCRERNGCHGHLSAVSSSPDFLHRNLKYPLNSRARMTWNCYWSQIARQSFTW